MKAHCAISLVALSLAGCASEVPSQPRGDSQPLVVDARQDELLARMQALVGRLGEEAAEQIPYEGSAEFQKKSKEAFLMQVRKSKDVYPGSDVGFRTNGLAFVLRDGKIVKVVLDADHIRRRSNPSVDSTAEKKPNKAPEPTPPSVTPRASERIQK